MDPSLKPVYLTNFHSGWITARDSSIIPDDAFESLVNAYVFRGRIVAKDGHSSLGRLQRDLTGQAMGSGSVASQVVTYNALVTTLSLGTTASIKPGTFVGTLASGLIMTDSASTGALVLSGTVGTASSAVINYITGVVTLTYSSGAGTSAGTADFSYYPGLPVMGLYQYQTGSLGILDTIAFDQKYAYRYDTSNSVWEEWNTSPVFTSNDYDFFWATNYYSSSGTPIFWITNFGGQSDDNMYYTDGSTYTTFNPAVDGSNFLLTARILIGYQNRLVALNTFEGANFAGGVSYVNRARWSWDGAPTDETDGWLTTSGKGGYIDAPTQEAIVSASIIKSNLIVRFTKSTWALVYSGNPEQAFYWRPINQQFGSLSTFADIGFDDFALGLDTQGVVASNYNSTDRIDLEQIPQVVQALLGTTDDGSTDSLKMVHGIRDYDKQLCYWNFVSNSNQGAFPDKLLVYNYEGKNWALFNESYTCFGYYEANATETWDDLDYLTWDEWSIAWDLQNQLSQPRQLIAGNQQGFTFVMNAQNTDSATLAISAVTAGTPPTLTVYDHNLMAGDVIYLDGLLESSGGTAADLNETYFEVASITDANTITLSEVGGDSYTLASPANYIGGGTIKVINNLQIQSKLFNIADIGRSTSLAYIDFLAAKTSSGELNVEIFQDATQTAVNDGTDDFFNTDLPTYAETETTSSRYSNAVELWHRFYCPVSSQFIQFNIQYSDSQLVDSDIYNADVDIRSIVLWLRPSGDLVF